jgi:hypothetical protein
VSRKLYTLEYKKYRVVHLGSLQEYTIGSL